ncbi:acyl-CoA synthetase [Bacillus dakarensis]|uniref:acyl-CoA synthetase n=1 Tax=Robertmurraya dakarensis TaxID=1926278 RepID=UPI000980DFD6|nr:long-chain fatty acid--CoA ligase [Bacillus dakarensis]
MTTSSIHASRQLLVGELIRRCAHNAPDQVAFILDDERITYKQLEGRTLHLAGWLQGKGIDIGDKVGIITKNCLEFIDIFFATAHAGGVSVPINFRLVPEEFAYIINNSDTKILFIEEEYQDMIQSIQHKIPAVEQIVVIGTECRHGMIPYKTIFDQDVTYRSVDGLLDDDDDCLLGYTSGTTGHPKGAVLTHKNLSLSAMNSLVKATSNPNVESTSTSLLVTPLFHIAGIGFLLISCTAGGTGVIHREFNPVKVLEDIEKEKINSTFLVPAMWNMVLSVPNFKDFDVTSMISCGTGAAATPVELKKRIIESFPNAGLNEAFGQTEMSPTTTHLRPEDTLRKTNSVGKGVLNVEIRVVDENMNDVPVGEVGEIVYRGPTVMKGYYKNPEATEEAFKGGWFHSGDLVKMDEEGYVYVMDRKKDMIISGGENIYPAEIEDVLYRHEAIYEAAVIGVPDELWGESVKAIVVLKPGKTLTEEDVIEHCKNHLASYKKPKYVEFMSELPRNTSGKVLKRVLRERV